VISKERLSQLAISLAITPTQAHALLQQVEAESEVVGYIYTFDGYAECLDLDEVESGNFKENPEMYMALIALPLVED
jgi:gamma-glutamylcyclotransferase (GGCT)/AIG2-like uncharacterized protein YtfP